MIGGRLLPPPLGAEVVLDLSFLLLKDWWRITILPLAVSFGLALHTPNLAVGRVIVATLTSVADMVSYAEAKLYSLVAERTATSLSLVGDFLSFVPRVFGFCHWSLPSFGDSRITNKSDNKVVFLFATRASDVRQVRISFLAYPHGL